MSRGYFPSGSIVATKQDDESPFFLTSLEDAATIEGTGEGVLSGGRRKTRRKSYKRSTSGRSKHRARKSRKNGRRTA